MKAALYVRCSTEEQSTEGFSISAQLTQLNDYCRKNNIEIHQAYADEGISGQKENRPEFQRMIRDAEKGMFNIILVHKFDRFARKVELSQRIKNQLKKSNVQVISISEPLEDSPMGFFVGGLHDLLAEYYVRNLAQETKKGHVERARQGLHNGSVPFGYRIDKLTGKMVIHEEQAKIVKWIFDMYINEGYGSTKIAVILNQHGIKTAVNGIWAHGSVNRILKNVKYIGKIYYDGEVYEGTHEPIISEDDFNLVQRYIKERTWKREYRGANYSKYLLMGLLRCGVCKHPMRIINYKSKAGARRVLGTYYVCNDAMQSLTISNCKHNKCYPVDKLENEILKSLKNISKKTLVDCNIKENVSINDVLSNQKDKLSMELSRAKQAFLAGVFTLEEYTEIKNKVETDISNIENSLSSKEDKAGKMKKKINNIMDKYNQAETIIEKKNILKEIIECIYISPDKIYIDFTL
jgi:site-specific DNA recombinase